MLLAYVFTHFQMWIPSNMVVVTATPQPHHEHEEARALEDMQMARERIVGPAT